MVDRTTIIVTYGPELDKKQLLRFGTIVNDLLRLSMLFLRVTEDVVSEVSALRGVVRVSYNETHPADEILHAVPSALTAVENTRIYEEMNLAAAHAITTGDPRVRIAVIDSGCSTDHNDINCIGGGRFFKGVYHADNSLPMKVKFSDLCAGIGVVMSAAVYVYDANRAKSGTPMTPAVCYADSTCKQALFTGTIPNEHLFNPNLTFWINQPVDILISDEEVDYWRTALGRTTMYDGFGHGTAVTGIVSDIAPDCTIVVLKLTTDDGMINTVDIIACLDYVADNDFHIVSTSWGGPASPEKTAAYDALVATGILWICSAGNSGVKPDTDVATDTYLFPGATPGVFCVGACGNQTAQNTDTGYIDYHPDTLDFSLMSWFSQKHDRVQIVAPGFGWQVHAPLNYCDLYQHSGEFSRNWNTRRYTFQRSGGTSWAQPAVAASAALMMSKIIAGYQTTDPAEVRSILLSSVNTVKTTLTSTAKGPVKLSNGNPAMVGYGAGRLDTGAAVGAI